MFGAILETLASFVIYSIESTGYFGITILMALESAGLPIPSEIIMPFSGFLAFQGGLSFFLVVWWGAVGNLVGSLAAYAVGYYGGRPFLKRYGRYFFFSPHDLEMAERLFQRHGSLVAFGSRLLPIVRTFISFPAGIAKMNIWRFSVYTFLGSVLWSWLLTYLGFRAGEHWDFLSPYFRRFDWMIVLLFGILLVWWVQRHFKRKS
tara:strand:+ start:46 stop:660 length:615 start_codon:yes stop_codon:yes gene_type:complete